VDGRQGHGIMEEDSKGSRGSQRAVELTMMMTDIHITYILRENYFGLTKSRKQIQLM
jgi:hypothetical protein